LRDAYADHGANAGGSIANNLLVDLRSGMPTLRAAAQCIHWEGGGACTAPDTSAVSYDHTFCTWQTSASDFLCTASDPFGGDYNPVYAKHEFYLFTGKEPSKLSWTPDALNSLKEFAAKFKGIGKPGDRALVRNVGYVDLLWKRNDLVTGNETMLLASTGAGDQDNARFYLAILSGSAEPTIQEVPKWSIGGEKTDDAAAPQGFTPSDDSLVTTASEFQIVSGTHLLKAVRTRAPETRVLYLVGIQAKAGKLISNAVRLASNGTTCARCGQEPADSTALSFNWIPPEQAAFVVVQPQESAVWANGEEPAPSCAWEGKLRWVDGIGFRVRKLRDLCKLATKDVSIDEQATISTKARVRDR
jgi:hypothetical protein